MTSNKKEKKNIQLNIEEIRANAGKMPDLHSHTEQDGTVSVIESTNSHCNGIRNELFSKNTFRKDSIKKIKKNSNPSDNDE